VLGLLSRVLSRLERGQIVEPVKVSANRPFSLPGEEEHSYETRRAQADLAADIYAQIYAEFPSAVRAVRKFERYSAEDQERSRRHQS